MYKVELMTNTNNKQIAFRYYVPFITTRQAGYDTIMGVAVHLTLEPPTICYNPLMTDHNPDLTGLEPALPRYIPDPISGHEPSLGGQHRVDPDLLDDLSAGKWTAVERLRRGRFKLTPTERSRYARALIARIETITPRASRPHSGDGRAPILLVLGLLGDPVALPHLLSALHSETHSVKRAATQALGQLGHPEAIPALLDLLRKYLHDHTSINPFIVVDALGRLAVTRPDPVVPTLLDLLESDVWPDLKLCALTALSRTGDPRSLDALIEILQTHWDFRHRREAVRALARIQHVRVVPTLTAALDDRYRDVRYAVAIALGNLTDQRATLPLQIAHASEAVYRVRIGIERALARLDAAPPAPGQSLPMPWFGTYLHPDS